MPSISLPPFLAECVLHGFVHASTKPKMFYLCVVLPEGAREEFTMSLPPKSPTDSN